MEDNPIVRIALAQQVQNAIDDVDMYVKLPATDEEIQPLIEYARKAGAPIPNIPEDDRRDDVIKTLTRFWTIRETLGCQVALLGGIERHIEDLHIGEDF